MPARGRVHGLSKMRRLLPAIALLASCLLPACGPGGDTESSGTTTTTSTSTTTEVPYESPPLEAGFLEVPAQPAAAFGARLFFSFHPAEEAPEKAPLLVFFNGGPGSATTAGLLPFGTGPFTMSTSMEVGDMPVPNPDSMSRFAHLLHVDARQTGFSYGLSDGSAGCLSDSSALFDAGDVLFGLLDFLDARPGLLTAPVVLVGESYGGTRAATMIHLVQHYGDAEPLPNRPDPRGVPGLVERIQAHFDLAHPERKGEVFTPDEVAEQFGFQVLIQPNFAGTIQFDFEAPLILADPVLQGYLTTPPVKSSYDVRVSLEEQDRRDDLAAYAVVTPPSFEALTGVAPEDVALFGAADRKAAFRTETLYPLPPEAFAEMEAHVASSGRRTTTGRSSSSPAAPGSATSTRRAPSSASCRGQPRS